MICKSEVFTILTSQRNISNDSCDLRMGFLLTHATNEQLIKWDNADPEDQVALIFEAYANYLETVLLMEREVTHTNVMNGIL